MTLLKSTDPTMDFLRRFDDVTQWHIVDNVPIFAPHVREGPDGKPIEVDEQKLYEIAYEAKALEQSRGVVPALILGHTRTEKGFDEKRQPDIVGFARDLKVGHFGPSRQIGLLARFYFYPDRVREAKSYPFRSVELYPAKGQITKVALLKRDPWLDLGIVNYASSGQLYYAREAGACFIPFYEGIMPENFDPTAPPMTPGEEDLSPEEMATADAYAKYYAEKCSHPMMQYMRTQYMAAPSATNGAVPGTEPSMPPAPGGEEDLETVKMQRDQLATQYQRLEARLGAIEKAKNTAEARELVNQLTAEGYTLPSDEVSRLAAMDEAGRKRRVHEVRSFYSKDPTAGGLLQFGEPDEPDGKTKSGNVTEGGELTKRGMRAALAYQQTAKCDYAEAREHIIQAG